MGESTRWTPSYAIDRIQDLIEIADGIKLHTPQYIIAGATNPDGSVDMEGSHHPMDEVTSLLKRIQSMMFNHYGRVMHQQAKQLDSIPMLVEEPDEPND